VSLRLFSPLCAVLLTAGASVAATGTASADSGVNLVNDSSGMCADATAWGQPVVQSECASTPSQGWYRTSKRTYKGTDYWLLKNAGSGLCMNVNGASSSNGAAIIMWRCSNSFTNELWRRRQVGNDKVEYVSPGGKCVTVAGNDWRPGAWLIQYSCVGAADQIWWPQGG
jgi:hypothetical protein